jgi:hypothetical protein
MNFPKICRSSIKQTSRKNEQLKKYPPIFIRTQKDRLQINLNRMHLSSDDLSFEWMKNICRELDIQSLKYFRNRMFRIEKIDNEITYKLCMSPQDKSSKNGAASAREIFMIIHFNKSKAYIYNLKTTKFPPRKTIKINTNDSDLLLQNIFSILKINLVSHPII